MRALATAQKRNVHSTNDNDATINSLRTVEREPVKRLSCEVKGQIDACERSARGAGSPYSLMPSDEQKAGYDQHTTHLHPNAVTSTKTAHNGEILNVLWELKKAGKADDTIRNVRKCLIVLDRLTNLQDPEAVKTFVATYDRNSGYKRNLIMAYEHYAKLYNFTWIKPKYHENAKMPKIPLEAKIDCIMTNAPLKLRTAIAISKDTGLRPVELMRLTLRSIDLQNGVVYPETAKHGSPRALRLTNKTVNILNKYVAAWNIDVNARLFGTWGDIRF